MKCDICNKPFKIKTLLNCGMWTCGLTQSTYISEDMMPHPSKNRPRKGRRKIGSKKRKARARR
jgi:hypothetical protein